LTGDVFGVTPPAGDNTKKLANTEFIQALASILVPVGCVQAYAGNTLPNGWLLCDGSAVSRTDYADLYAVVGDTYGNGDGSTTFNLPDLVDKFVEGSATAGTEHSAGLPNITGDFSGRRAIFNGSYSNVIFGGNNGAMHIYNNSETGVSVVAGGAGGSSGTIVEFSASWSNSIYGNSTTVQPPALTMQYIIKY
jgi:microcystin-dependent protein